MKNFLSHHGMAYELEWFERFILNHLFVLIRDNVELTDASLAEGGRELDEEVERIKLRTRRDTIHLGEGYDTTTYVRLYKEALMQLGGLRYAAQGSERNSMSTGVIILSQLTFQAIENLLVFLETSFDKFFDLDSRTPEVYLEVASRRASLSEKALLDQLNEFAPDPKLLETVMLPFRQLANSREQDISYRKISNLRHLEKELSMLSRSTTTGTINADLRTLLHRINFNFAEFFHYCTSDVLQQLATAAGAVEKQVSILTEFKLYLEGIPVRTEFTFASYPPLRQSLLGWIESRLTDIERTRPAVVKVSAKSPEKKSLVARTIQMLMSANEVGYFIGLLIRGGLIDKRHRPMLVELFSSNFLSKDGEEMDQENLRKKGYPEDIGIGVMKKVREFLMRIIAIIDDDIKGQK